MKFLPGFFNHQSDAATESGQAHHKTSEKVMEFFKRSSGLFQTKTPLDAWMDSAQPMFVVQSRMSKIFREKPLIDTGTLKDFKDSGLLKKLPRYLGSIHDRIELLATHVQAKNASESQKVVHSLIGPTAMLGAFALSSYISELDSEMCRTSKMPIDEYWLETIQQLYTMTAETMQLYFDAHE